MRRLAARLGLAVAGCSGPPLSYSLPAGTVDARPASYPGDNFQNPPPWLIGSVWDPNKGLGVQGFADKLIGAHVADFAVHHVVNDREMGRLHFFYPAARSGPGPGLCRARVYSGFRYGEASPRGSWQGEVFAVAGSVAPLPRLWPAGYRERLNSACRARRDMGRWFRAPVGQAYVAARLADAVVASARRKGPIPFELVCRPYTGTAQPAPCHDGVRKIVAAVDPRAIVQVAQCGEKTKLPCLSVGLAQGTGRGRAAKQWRLDVQYRDKGGMRIVRVDVDDIQLEY